VSATRDLGLMKRFDALVASGELQEAATLARMAIAKGNRELWLYMRLSVVLLKLGEYRRAAEFLEGATALAPAEPGELVEFGRRLMYFNLAGAMREVAGRLLDKPRWNAAAEADFAALLSMAGEQERAYALLQRAQPALGNSPGLLYNRSQMQLYRGELAQAEADLRLALRLDPNSARSWWALSKLPAASASAAELQAMQRLAERMPGSQDEVYLRFALFNFLDRLDRPDAAWTELERGCRAKRAGLKYDAAGTAQLFDALMRFTPAPAATGARAEVTPIFVVGMHRSGTTLLERILGNHSQIAAGGELYEFPAQLRRALGRHFGGASDAALVDADIDFGKVGEGYLRQVAWRAEGKPFLVDKLPSNFLNAGFIRAALPGAKILHMRRGAMDTCFSNLKELFSNAAAYSYEQGELADFFLRQRALMAHWQKALPGFVLEVDYESLAREPETQARRILDFCGLPWEPGCVDLAGNARAVNTASSAQVREAIHQRGIAAWRRYEPWLGPLATRIGHAAPL
jgi:tetratricopeptide (TPR) repeat protein